MFKGHPKGLIIAFFANMGERFGFYTMMAILVLFLQAKYGLAADKAGIIFSVFYFLIYALALVGGFIADRSQNYKGTISVGIVVMFVGYMLMAVPGFGLVFTLFGLFVIAFGNGLFKGNLQALVGQMYDDPKFSGLRDSAFSVFYMGINIGAFFAPSAARYIRTWYLNSQGFAYDADLPQLSHSLLKGNLTDTSALQALADKVTLSGAPVTDIYEFAQNYINVFSTGFHYAFGIAAIAMLLSLTVFSIFKTKLPDRKKAVAAGTTSIEMPWAEEKKRLIALGLVFIVVIFFWMSFHQNGLTLTLFARDYTVKTVDSFTNIFFDIRSFLSVIGAVIGVFLLLRKASTMANRIIGLALILSGAYLTWYFYGSFSDANIIEPEIYQQFNPIFIVFLTPIVIGLFAWLRKRNIEPSSPKKIGIGMIITTLAFGLLLVGSISLESQASLGSSPSPDRVSAYWLINTYLILTIAELFLSPMGISFVSKVAPPRFQGLMQGGWLGATALGNQLLFIGTILWMKVEVWQVWLFFIVCCLVSVAFVFSILKRLEKATN